MNIEQLIFKIIHECFDIFNYLIYRFLIFGDFKGYYQVFSLNVFHYSCLFSHLLVLLR